MKRNLIYLLLLVFFVSENVKSQNINSEKNDSLYKDFKTEFIWEARVKIGSMINVGESKRGTRRIIPIIGVNSIPFAKMVKKYCSTPAC